MQKCTDAAFCNRLLGTVDEGYQIDPQSVKIAGASLSAKLVNEQKGSEFRLALTAYDGFVRLYVNEDESKNRFEVPGVLMHDLESRQLSWDKVTRKKDVTNLQLGNAVVQLQHKPLHIEINLQGQPVMSFNGRKLFNFEHIRQKQVQQDVYSIAHDAHMCCRCKCLTRHVS